MTTTKTATPIGAAVVDVYNMHFNGGLHYSFVFVESSVFKDSSEVSESTSSSSP